MPRLSLAAMLSLGSLVPLAGPAIAAAQDVPGLAEARTVAQCVHEQDQHIQRLMHLIEQAEQRARASGVAEDVRRDAITSIEALVDRVRQHAQHARHCVEHTHIPVRVDEQVTEEAAPSHGSLASEHGTVHEVEAGTSLAPDVRVVRGERVDGSGSAPDENVRAAVRAAAPRLARCYDEYLDRASRRSGEVNVSITADGARVRAAVETAGGFDVSFGQCVERAAREIRIAGQHGRSVYAYTIRFGSD